MSVSYLPCFVEKSAVEIPIWKGLTINTKNLYLQVKFSIGNAYLLRKAVQLAVLEASF